jgi:hypothetical protein
MQSRTRRDPFNRHAAGFTGLRRNARADATGVAPHTCIGVIVRRHKPLNASWTEIPPLEGFIGRTPFQRFADGVAGGSPCPSSKICRRRRPTRYARGALRQASHRWNCSLWWWRYRGADLDPAPGVGHSVPTSIYRRSIPLSGARSRRHASRMRAVRRMSPLREDTWNEGRLRAVTGLGCCIGAKRVHAGHSRPVHSRAGDHADLPVTGNGHLLGLDDDDDA